ncbi:MAG: hypothetical protein PHV34_12110 [Verrucomicrobiae bacterium]|nr:hypothetical protein [Verrucomicrobiae bacterium]
MKKKRLRFATGMDLNEWQRIIGPKLQAEFSGWNQRGCDEDSITIWHGDQCRTKVEHVISGGKPTGVQMATILSEHRRMPVKFPLTREEMMEIHSKIHR